MRLFLDPGITTGYALFDLKGGVKDFGQVAGVDNLLELLTMIHRETPLTFIWFEPYLIDNNKIFNNEKGQERKSQLSYNEKKGHEGTLKSIGYIESFAKINTIEFSCKRFNALSAAYKQAGMKMLPKSQHKDSHQFDALAYGKSWQIIHGLTKIRRRPIV